MAFGVKTFVLAALAIGSPVWALDPALARFAGSGAVVITGIDVSAVRDAPFGQFLFNRISAADSRFERVFQLTGFDPKRDLHEVLVVADSLGDVGVGGTPAAALSGTGIIAVKGTFNESRWTELVGAHGAVTEYRGHKLLGNGTSDSAVAFLQGILIAGREADVRKAIDRQAEGPPAADPAAMARIQELSTRHHVWVLSNGSPSRLAGALPGTSRNIRSALSGSVLQGITDVAFGFHFGTSVVIAGEATTRSAEDAETLADVARFFASLAKSNGGAPAGLTNLLLSLNLKPDGKMLRFTMTAPERDIERLFDSGRAQIRPVVLR